jgi:uncharacterized protein YbjT (DUF2867 family)
MSRASGVDVVTGSGLAEALTGAECIVDAATGPSAEQASATAFFAAAARNLQAAGTRAGVRRIVVVSIIAVDRFRGGYGAAKLAHERALQAGPIPVQILRAAQFHEFVGQLMDWGRQGDVCSMTDMRTQLVAARTVAEALVDLATGPAPADAPIPEIAGPRAESLVDMARLLAARQGESLRIECVTNPSDPDHALYGAGALLPSPHATLAGPTFQEWLDSLDAPASAFRVGMISGRGLGQQ